MINRNKGAFVILTVVLVLAYFFRTWWYLTSGSSKYWQATRYDRVEKKYVALPRLQKYNWDFSMDYLNEEDSIYVEGFNKHYFYFWGENNAFGNRNRNRIIYQSADSIVVVIKARASTVGVFPMDSAKFLIHDSNVLWDIFFYKKVPKPSKPILKWEKVHRSISAQDLSI